MPRWPARTVEQRLLDMVAIDASAGCWEWSGHRRKDGYGSTTVGGKSWLAHRVLYELQVGPIPDGLTLDHLCRNRACVNPAHLEPVTMRENILRGEGRGARQARQTHCKRGHEFTPANTLRYPHVPNRRHCLACRDLLRRS